MWSEQGFIVVIMFIIVIEHNKNYQELSIKIIIIILCNLSLWLKL